MKRRGRQRIEPGMFYRAVLETLNAKRAPYLVGGAYGLEHFTGIARHTKDVDVFVRPRHRDRVLGLLADAGYETEVRSSVWLAKAFYGEDFADVIFASGNGVAVVDDGWFQHAPAGRVLGVPVRICPAEETIWSKAYIMERERYDGADIAHLLRACGPRLDWERLLARFAPHPGVLLSHLVLFRFVYPNHRAAVPDAVLAELWRCMDAEPAPDGAVCRGTLLSRAQYRVDVEQWGYRDARLRPEGPLTEDEAASVDRA
jgi:hypothetical protein